jgi:hypothetical protein
MSLMPMKTEKSELLAVQGATALLSRNMLTWFEIFRDQAITLMP